MTVSATAQELRILVAVDRLLRPEPAFRMLRQWARRQPLRATLFSVSPTPGESQLTRAWLDHMHRSPDLFGVSNRVETVTGVTVPEILARALVGRFDFILMTTHGRSGVRRLLLGSVAEQVLRHARTPILLVKGSTVVRPLDRIVVALDGSPKAEEILPKAVDLARAHGAILHLLRIGRSRPAALDYLKKLCATLAREGMTAVPVFRPGGAPASEIRRYADETTAGLICMTSHGRTGLGRVLMGSVAESVLRRSELPVLVRRMAEAPIPSTIVV